MDCESNEQQPKQVRTRWTSSLDKIFADIVVEQIQLGNRPNNVFDKKTWNYIRDEFNRQTNLNFNNNQLRKHLDVLRTRYSSLKSAVQQNDVMEDSCYIGFDLWEDIAAQPKPETPKIKECPIYDQLCTIFADSGTDGKYAQSSHYEELDKSAGPDLLLPDNENQHPKTPSSSRFLLSGAASPKSTNKSVVGKKRKRLSEMCSLPDHNRGQETINSMAKAMSAMVAALKCRTVSVPQIDERFTIGNCIKALDEMEGVDDTLYYAALDLFEVPNLRETFLSIKNSKVRFTWLHGKCGNPVS